jgi:hypothetical protein
VKLKEWNWDTQQYDEFEYDDEIIKGFVEYFRLNKQWREDPDVVFARWLKFERDLTDARNDAATLAAPLADRCTADTKSGNPCRNTIGIENGICAVHRRALVAA